jgi:dienelactone hydrolase
MSQGMEVKMRIKPVITLGLVALLLSACGEEKSTTLQDSLTTENTVDTISNYDLGARVIPFPNDFLFPQAGDGTLDIPVVDADDLSDPAVAMNGLDGFSTVAPMSTGFTDAIATGSITGDSVRVYPITKGFGPTGPATGVSAPLTFGVDYVAALSSVDATDSTLVILPLEPLDPKASYAVVITSDLKSTSGRPVGISGSYALTRGATPLYDTTVPPAIPPSTAEEIEAAILAPVLKPAAGATEAEIVEAGVSALTLETLRANVVKPTEDAILAADTSISSGDIILHWTFTTQSTRDVLAQLREDIRAGAAPASSFLPISPGANPVMTSPLGGADIYVGSVDVPYFLETASGIHDPAPLASFWKAEDGSLLSYMAPSADCSAGVNICVGGATTQTIPLLVSIPKTGSAPWPVVIYQHGITTNRATMLAVADAMAAAGMAVVAIDMPMHGLTGDETNGTEALYSIASIKERTFDLDLVTQDSDGNVIAATPDGVTDTSGTHYVNLTNLQNTRDNVRQSVSDLFSLAYALTAMDYDDGGPDFDTSRVYFLGHSMGAIAGTTFLAHEQSVRDAVFAFGGTGVAKILDGSSSFGPVIAARLALAAKVVKGTADYESFLGAAQTVVDSGDPVNHAATAAEGRGILFFEIVGSASSPSDLTVPNTVPDGNDVSGTVPAPLAGTEPQLALMGLTHVNSTQGPGASDLKLVTKFISGYHGSLLDPSAHPLADPSVTTEIQTEAASFLASDGLFLPVNDPSVLQAPNP